MKNKSVPFLPFLPLFALKNVKQIEVIRGPGSALYGENAFLAVINIVTKDADDIEGFDVASGFGSYDTQNYSILFGKTVHDVEISGLADFYNTNGLNTTLDTDAFSDQPSFNRFSGAPGRVDDSRNKLDMNLKLAYKDLYLNSKYMNKDTEPFVGAEFVLTDDGENRFNYASSELGYKMDIGERLTFKPRAYYDQYDIEFFIEPFPDGFTIPSDIDGDGDNETFPDGMLARARATNRRLGSELQFDYQLLENNTFTWGFEYIWERQDNVTMHSNFDPLTERIYQYWSASGFLIHSAIHQRGVQTDMGGLCPG